MSAALRKHIVEEYKIDPADLDQKIESTIKDLLGRHAGEAPRDEPSEGEIIDNHSTDLARKIAATNAITPMLLLQTLRKGEVWMFEGMFAQLTGLRTNLVRRLVYEPSGEGLAIACEAAELTNPDFGSLCLLSRAARPGDKTVEPDEVARVIKFSIGYAWIPQKMWSTGGSWIPTICLPFDRLKVESRQKGGRRGIEARSGPIPFSS